MAFQFVRLVLVALVLLFVTDTLCAGPRGKVAVGDDAPAWSGLPGIDGKRHALKELAKAEAVLVVFFANTCPYATAYDGRLTELAKKHVGQLAVVLINVVPGEDDSLAAMKAYAEDKLDGVAYLRDDSQEIAHKFGAKSTPHCFLLDKQRKVAYMGAFDDSRRPEKVTEHHVADAVAAVLAGNPVARSETRAIGCSIPYE